MEKRPAVVQEVLEKYLLVDGLPLIFDLERSSGSWAVDTKTGEKYLDFFSFFASLPLGFNHKAFSFLSTSHYRQHKNHLPDMMIVLKRGIKTEALRLAITRTISEIGSNLNGDGMEIFSHILRLPNEKSS